VRKSGILIGFLHKYILRNGAEAQGHNSSTADDEINAEIEGGNTMNIEKLLAWSDILCRYASMEATSPHDWQW